MELAREAPVSAAFCKPALYAWQSAASRLFVTQTLILAPRMHSVAQETTRRGMQERIPPAFKHLKGDHQGTRPGVRLKPAAQVSARAPDARGTQRGRSTAGRGSGSSLTRRCRSRSWANLPCPIPNSVGSSLRPEWLRGRIPAPGEVEQSWWAMTSDWSGYRCVCPGSPHRMRGLAMRRPCRSNVVCCSLFERRSCRSHCGVARDGGGLGGCQCEQHELYPYTGVHLQSACETCTGVPRAGSRV